MDITRQHSIPSPGRENGRRSDARTLSVQKGSLSSEEKSLFFENIKYAISAHNSQPFNVGLEGDTILISLDRARELPVADPAGKDLALSLGALVECMDLTLNYLGFEIDSFKADLESVPTAEIKLIKLERPRIDTKKLHLFELMKVRQSYRKPYSKTRLKTPFMPLVEGATVTEDRAVINEIAKLYDRVNIRFLRKKGYVEELNEWLRFSPSDANYLIDGLNREAMGLSDLEAKLGKTFFHSSVFKGLSLLNLDRLVFSEAAKLKTAQFMVAIHCDKDVSLVDQGRIFFRAWTEVTHYNLFGAPLSLLTDDPQASKKVKELFDIPQERTLINVLSLGVVDWSIEKYDRARRNLEESIYV